METWLGKLVSTTTLYSCSGVISMSAFKAGNDMVKPISLLALVIVYAPELGSVPLPVTVPLWQLVYHDSVLNYVAEGGYTTERFRISGGDYLAFLALYGLLPTQFDKKELYLSQTMREAYTSEMIRHEYLTPVRNGFRAVAHSLFGDGTEVVANFTDSPFLYEGRETPPHDFILFKRGEK